MKISRKERRIQIRRQGCEFVSSLHMYFEIESNNGGLILDIARVVDRTAAALSVQPIYGV